MVGKFVITVDSCASFINHVVCAHAHIHICNIHTPQNPHKIHVLVVTVSLSCPFFRRDSVFIASELVGSGNVNRSQMSVAGRHSCVGINKYMQIVS